MDTVRVVMFKLEGLRLGNVTKLGKPFDFRAHGADFAPVTPN
jgi:hypothetical protein